MRLNRIQISEDSRNKLSILKGRTGLLPNVLSRIGLMLSLTEANEPVLDVDTTDGSEFNRFTLMGEWDSLIIALLEERGSVNGMIKDNDTLVKYFRAHLNRGVLLLYSRVKGIEDLVNLLP
ncbi:DNA sulfur modification protein DndE [Candidatus Poribacteria bacterium]|nr:DNA sulfur modification protein DndE [Candidatus Poribacteria bacterium]